jgi:hypothetical protein
MQAAVKQLKQPLRKIWSSLMWRRYLLSGTALWLAAASPASAFIA